MITDSLIKKSKALHINYIVANTAVCLICYNIKHKKEKSYDELMKNLLWLTAYFFKIDMEANHPEILHQELNDEHYKHLNGCVETKDLVTFLSGVDTIKLYHTFAALKANEEIRNINRYNSIIHPLDTIRTIFNAEVESFLEEYQDKEHELDGIIESL